MATTLGEVSPDVNANNPRENAKVNGKYHTANRNLYPFIRKLECTAEHPYTFKN